PGGTAHTVHLGGGRVRPTYIGLSIPAAAQAGQSSRQPAQDALSPDLLRPLVEIVRVVILFRDHIKVDLLDLDGCGGDPLPDHAQLSLNGLLKLLNLLIGGFARPRKGGITDILARPQRGEHVQDLMRTVPYVHAPITL